MTQVDTPASLPGAGASQDEHLAALSGYKYGWHDSDAYAAASRRGLSEDVVRGISAMKHEPQWMLDMRLKALKLFQRKPMPTWGVDISTIDFDQIKYFVRAQERQAASWEDLPADIKNTYDRLGIPEAEKDRLVAGVAAQYESEVVYHKINEELGKQGVVFLDTDTALKEEPELFREHFASAVPLGDNKFSALNSAVWSGGTFIRAEGCPLHHPAAGLLPYEYRESRTVRADPDYRRRGRVRSLRRGLHCPDLQVGFPARRGRRDHR